MRFTCTTNLLLLCLTALVPSASAGFHLFLRYQNLCDIECNKKTDVCWPKHYVEWRVGAVPSSQYNCNAFKDDRNFPNVLPQSGQDFNWNGYNFPGICGTGSVDFWQTNNGQTLEVWVHNANPGQKVATCYKQQGNSIDCGRQSCYVTEVHDVWVCADTKLCS
ncbi:hypothetical protein AK830_g6515 [Neonectria ditissima]|uniref:Secreted protein n=1 Tax=Neonectria ditissima TaxID=78410 RepID=A0A0P7B1T0_9HYPO|nr:hypothetical protein AK830_g6515 [Neonectria ditissima]